MSELPEFQLLPVELDELTKIITNYDSYPVTPSMHKVLVDLANKILDYAENDPVKETEALITIERTLRDSVETGGATERRIIKMRAVIAAIMRRLIDIVRNKGLEPDDDRGNFPTPDFTP